jgi:hypothetical protein
VQIPPELMTPEQREERAAEVEREISREWVRFAVTEWVILIPTCVVIGLLVTRDAQSAAVPVAIVGVLLCGALVTYWIVRRIQPRQKELQQLREGSG